jgi:YL1 nuclear protein C-terminal domain
VALGSIARQIQTCPITGLQARYRDPRTGVPYANAGAFRILTRLLAQEYVWSPAGAPDGIGVFVGHEKQRGAAGVPDCWGEAMGGVEDNWQKKRVEGNKEEKVNEKEKELRVGERRSSRIAGDAGEATEKSPASMDVDKATEGEQPMISS